MIAAAASAVASTVADKGSQSRFVETAPATARCRAGCSLKMPSKADGSLVGGAPFAWLGESWSRARRFSFGIASQQWRALQENGILRDAGAVVPLTRASNMPPRWRVIIAVKMYASVVFAELQQRESRAPRPSISGARLVYASRRRRVRRPVRLRRPSGGGEAPTAEITPALTESRSSGGLWSLSPHWALRREAWNGGGGSWRG